MTGKVKMERRSAAAHRQGNGELVIATSIVDLFVSVGADVEGWGEPYRHQRTHAVSARVDATAQAFQQAAPAALLFEAAATIGAGLVSSVKPAADFEQSMAVRFAQ